MKNKTQWQYCYICFIFVFFVSNAYAVSIRSVEIRYDFGGNGIIDMIYYSIDENCLPKEQRFDNNADGIIDSVIYITYDFGKYLVVTTKEDSDADGKIDRISRAWDENNAGEKRSITEEDLDGDGAIDSFRCEVRIDENFSTILKIYKGTGSYNGAGNLISVSYLTKDANGNTVKAELDNDADGLIDEIEYNTYDENCLLILSETDNDNDGTINFINQTTYNDKCSPLREEIDSDLVVYGIRNISKTIMELDYTYDVYGFPIKVETHTTLTMKQMDQIFTTESTDIIYMTNEYGEGDCGPYTECLGCTNIDQNDDGDLNTYYHDYDGDGFGDPNTSTESSTQPSGYVLDNADCNDDDSSINPGASDIVNDGIDQNCSGFDTIYTLYYPHIASNANWETEICVVNENSQQSLNGQFVAYSNSGERVNSLSVTLSPNGRRGVTVGSELSNPGSIGYIIFESDSANACGYTKFYQEGKSRVAIPSTSDINAGDIYISHIASNLKWWTGVSLLNTTSSSKTITFEFDDGTTKTKTIAAKEHKVFTIKSLFGGISQPSIKSAVIKNASGIVGLELFGSTGSNGDSYLSGILLKDDTTSNIYYPHIASNAKWWTGIVAYNPSDSSSALTITPYNADGTELSSQVLNLDPKEKYIGSAKALNFPDGSAWFKVTSTSPIVGFELFGTNDGKQLGGYSGVGINGTSGVFPKNETEEGWTGIAFVNIEESATTITMTAYDDSGNIVATESLILNGYEKVVSGASGLFSGDISSATYISYSSTGDVVGFQLNGSTDSMMLDALPGM